MTEECNWCMGVGVIESDLKPGTVVAVAINRASSGPYGSALISLATVVGPADRAGWHWLAVFTSPEFSPLEQQFHQNEILGVPAYGLTHAPTPAPPAGAAAHQIDPTVPLSRFANREDMAPTPPPAAEGTPGAVG